MKDKKRVVGYIRVSTTAQDAERQRLLIERYCEEHGYNLIDVLKDEGISGAVKDRPNYLKLLSLSSKETDIVIVSELSRLSRQEDIISTLSDVNNLLQNNLDIIFIDNNSYYKGGKLLELIDVMKIAIAADYAREERKKIKQRMSTGLERAFLQSDEVMATGSTIPFGYSPVPNPNYERGKTPKTLLKQDKNANVVRMIYQWCLDGLTIRKIVDRLIERGIKTRKGEDFSYSTITHILHQPLYKGEWKMIHNRKAKDKEGKSLERVLTKKGDAIISEEVWEQVQVKLKDNSICDIKRIVNFNPLKGILKCPCGKNMYIAPYSKGNKRYYRCAVKKNKYNQIVCSNGGVSVDLALRIVWAILKGQIMGKEFEQVTTDKIQAINIEISEITYNIQTLNKEIDELKANQETLLSNLSIITNPEILNRLQIKYEGQGKKIQSKEKQISVLKEERNKKEILKNQLSEDTELNKLDNLLIEDKAKLFQKYLDKVIYYNENIRSGTFVILFKNGSKVIVCMNTRNNNPIIVQMPNGSEFSEDMRKVLIPLNPPIDKTKPFEILEPVLTPYSANEALRAFNVEELRIEELTNYPYFE